MDITTEFLTRHLITYLGNKRKLLEFINSTVDEIKLKLGNQNPSMMDGFSGSGSVARLFKHYASSLWVNDLEDYSETLNTCYLANKSEVSADVYTAIDWLNAHKLDEQPMGFIERHYAPKNDTNIAAGERVFYTNQNAKIIDNLRRLIERQPLELRPFVLSPLLVKASIHTNTSGVFKGFHKKGKIGHFGGAGEHALSRIQKEITLDYPIFCDYENEVHVLKGDMNEIVNQVPELDVVYYDPPYNQHPYGSNYFMLNVINNYDDPEIQNGVSGIAKDWNKSAYNKRRQAEEAMDYLIAKTKAKYVLISYNNEGIIPIDIFESILHQYGSVELKTQSYQTYRGSKNLGKGKTLKDGSKRPLQVEELLWIVKK